MIKRVYWTFVMLAAAGQFFPIHAEQKPAQWIKICEKPVCLTYHERLDGDTGTVIVSAGIRQYEDSERTDLVILLRPKRVYLLQFRIDSTVASQANVFASIANLFRFCPAKGSCGL